MGVYHITYTPKLKEICLYLDGGCNFSCHGCISKYHPEDCHLDETPRQTKNKTLSQEGVISYLEPLSFKSVIFLGWEPTQDRDFLPLARILKERFSTYNIFLTNGYEFIEDKALDEVCVSIKAISKELFKDFTGKDNPERVLKNFKRYVNTSALRIRAESVFIPTYIDIDEIERVAKFISEIDPNIPYRIDAYIPYSNDRFRRPTKSEMEEAKIISDRYLKNVSILHYRVGVKYKVERIY
ncbi:MAG: radical SAM protein [Nitrospirota bacterium]